MRRACVSVVVCALLAASCAVGARADGLPVLGIDAGGTGVASIAGNARYVTLLAGGKTVVARIDPRGGRVLASTLLRGRFTIPAVAYDGSASGLSADGKRLVLIEPRQSFPRRETRFAFLSTRWLRPLGTVTLHGDFSFDAISPRGAFMYLIQYTTPRDPTRYLVRAYDLRNRQLLAKPVVDPREKTDKMRGSPLTRATSAGGRVAYTLYDGAGATPFIHALDTSHGTAHCIDLAMLKGKDYLWQLRLSLGRDGRTLAVRDGDDVEAVVDTQTFRVSTPTPAVGARTAESHSLRIALASIAVLATLGLLACGAVIVRRRHRPARAGEAAT